MTTAQLYALVTQNEPWGRCPACGCKIRDEARKCRRCSDRETGAYRGRKAYGLALIIADDETEHDPRAAYTPEVREKLAAAKRGKARTDEFKSKLSAYHQQTRERLVEVDGVSFSSLEVGATFVLLTGDTGSGEWQKVFSTRARHNGTGRTCWIGNSRLVRRVGRNEANP